MQKVSTLFLRIAVWSIGAVALLICSVALRAAFSPEDELGYRPILVGLCVAAIPFFMALHQILKLLGYVDKNTAFSDMSAVALQKIKYCAFAIGLMFTAGMPYIYHVANKDDAPGVVAIGLVIIFITVVLGVFAGVLERLFRSAIAMKKENDLTV